MSAHAVSEEPLSLTLLWVGIGCQQGVTKRLIQQAIGITFRAYALHESAIAGVATIDTKANEAGLIAFCSDRGLPLYFYTAEKLRSVPVPCPSSAIEAVVGTPSVAEAAALLVCEEAETRHVDQASTAEAQRHRECTSPPLSRPSTPYSKPILHVPKQCYRDSEAKGTVTIAIARLCQRPKLRLTTIKRLTSGL